MSKNILLTFMLIFLSANVFAQSYRKNLRCEINAQSQWNKNHKICSAIEDIEGVHRCNIDKWEAFGNSTCSNYGRSSAANQIFIEKRRLSAFEDGISGKISIDSMRDQRRKLHEMSMEEFRAMDKFIDGELSDMQQSQALRRSYNFFEQAIGILGGSAGRANQNNSMTTYILNGRAITCTTMGSFVTCN